jgi:glycosyltransferase involved in cell wall biosynthesis
MRVPKSQCIIVPYGIEQKEPPADKAVCKKAICEKHQLDPSLPLLFFNGALNYKPNSDALDIILKEILPRLIKNNFNTHIIIAGRGLSEETQSLISAKKEIIYAGFVDDINTYTKAADILLNPVVIGGGVKTKMIEALGLGTTVVSTRSGAKGIEQEQAGEKLYIADDHDWDRFTELFVEGSKKDSIQTPEKFYQQYYWGHIIAALLKQLS